MTEGDNRETVLSFHYVDSVESNSGHEAWWQAPLLTQPARRPDTCFFFTSSADLLVYISWHSKGFKQNMSEGHTPLLVWYYSAD